MQHLPFIHIFEQTIQGKTKNDTKRTASIIRNAYLWWFKFYINNREFINCMNWICSSFIVHRTYNWKINIINTFKWEWELNKFRCIGAYAQCTMHMGLQYPRENKEWLLLFSVYHFVGTMRNRICSGSDFFFLWLYSLLTEPCAVLFNALLLN